ncbi:MAG: hypothetical protein SFX73_10595 [Kofleriaceae bacterium]|nr:hypothetical protein [Kofleriaceae bacterium]
MEHHDPLTLSAWLRLTPLCLLLTACFDAHTLDGDGSRRDGGAPLEPCMWSDELRRCDRAACGLCPGEVEWCLFQDDAEEAGVCMESWRGTLPILCLDLGRCPMGSVCATERAAAQQPPDWASRAQLCVDPAECVRARDARGPGAELNCFYGDYTPASTGALPLVSCDDRPMAGFCGRGCECSGTGEGCLRASELHPWGLCTSAAVHRCDDPFDCSEVVDIGYPHCLRVNIPAALREANPDVFDGSAGSCTSRAICEAMAALYPDAYTCELRPE